MEFDFSNANSALRFDDPQLHENSTAQKVDFIAEFNDAYRFVEVKDPDCPGATNLEGFKQKLQGDQLINSLAGKYRDTVFFRINCSNHNSELPIDYIVVLAMASLDPTLIITKQDSLYRSIPLQNGAWIETSARSCLILSLEKYKYKFGENSVRRISESGG